MISVNLLNKIKSGKRGKVLLPLRHLSWLGLDVDLVVERFRAYNIHVIDFAQSTGRGALPRQGHSEPSNELFEALAVYPVCVESEMSLSELRARPDDALPFLERWSQALRQRYREITILYDQHEPLAVAVVQGYEPSNAIARLIGIKRGVPVVAFENTAFSDRLLWDNISCVTTNKSLAKNFYWRLKDTLPQAEIDRFTVALSHNFFHRKADEHKSARPEEPLPKDFDGPTVVFLGQVYTDSSILFGSGGWQGTVQVVQELMKLCLKRGARLIVKLHPKESAGCAPITNKPYEKLTYRKLIEAAALDPEPREKAHIVIDETNRYNTHALVQQANAVVTINSQAGLEAAMQGVPVVVCGEAFYGGLGFTYDAISPSLLGLHLSDALELSEADKKQHQCAALEFGCIYFTKYCIAKTVDTIVHLLLTQVPALKDHIRRPCT